MNKNIKKTLIVQQYLILFNMPTDYYDFKNGATMQNLVDTIMADKNRKIGGRYDNCIIILPLNYG